MDYTAQIKSKGLDATGVTEDVVRDLYSKLGSHIILIVEARVDARSDGTDGTHKVQLSLTQVEPATDANLTNHLRELMRTVYFNRQVDQGQPTLDSDGIEPKVEDVLAAGAKFRPHPYLTSQLALDDAGENGPICDVCGLIEAEPVHRSEPDDHVDDTEDEDQDEPVDEDEEQSNEDEPDDATEPDPDDQRELDEAGDPINSNVVAFSNR